MDNTYQCTGMSYLEEIENLGKDANPFFCLLNIEPKFWEEGKSRLEMKVRSDMTNGEGWLQGGIYTSLIDEAMALAIYTLLNDGETIATISCTTSFIRGVRAGDLVIAEAEVIKRGRQIIFAQGRVYSVDNNADLAFGSASFSVRHK